MYIASGTPEKEMKKIVKERGLNKYFVETYGSPSSKTSAIQKIIKDNNGLPEEIMFIGDSQNDLEAAEETGVFFVARILDKNDTWHNSFTTKMIVKDLMEVKDQLSSK